MKVDETWFAVMLFGGTLSSPVSFGGLGDEEDKQDTLTVSLF